jgi:subtilisin family serine protease
MILFLCPVGMLASELLFTYNITRKTVHEDFCYSRMPFFSNAGFHPGTNLLTFILLCAGVANINAQESPDKISSYFQPLLSLSTTNLADASSSIYENPSFISLLGIHEGMVPVDITASSSIQALLYDLEVYGCKVHATYAHVVSGRCPMSSFSALGELKTVDFVHPVLVNHNTQYKKNNAAAAKLNRVLAGSVQSEGVKAMKADIVHSTYGLIGTGVKIGVLSDSFNALGGYQTDITSGDLPSGVVVLKDYFLSDGIDEGRAMLQLIHDVAPGAKLYFHTAFDGLADFASGIIKLAEAGCKVIVDDIIYFAEAPFQDDLIAQAVDQVHSMGVAYFSSAGNNARQSWTGPFVDSGLLYNGSPINNFNPSNPLALPDPRIADRIPISLDNGISIIVLGWDQPSSSASPAKGSLSDLDIYIFDEETDSTNPLFCPSVYCLGGTDSNIGGDAVEVLLIDVSQVLLDVGRPSDMYKLFTLMIVHYEGPYASNMQISIFSGDFTNSLKSNSGTSYGHANARGAAGVAAAYSMATPAYGVANIQLESFSSSGGVPILFDNDGNRLPKAEIRLQPRFTGPDGASNTFFGRSYNGFPNPLFFGTSASAPHVAAVGALMLQGNPELKPDEIFEAIQATAIDMNDNYFWTSMGFDFASGYGFVDAAAAVKYKKGKKSKKPKKQKVGKKARIKTIN